jgi:hypothetical protein
MIDRRRGDFAPAAVKAPDGDERREESICGNHG